MIVICMENRYEGDLGQRVGIGGGGGIDLRNFSYTFLKLGL